MGNLEFECFIDRKSINGNEISKHSNHKFVKLTHVRNYKSINSVLFEIDEYEKYIESIDDRYDTLAYMLDDLFDCEMISKNNDG
jgi:hypothetical protein